MNTLDGMMSQGKSSIFMMAADILSNNKKLNEIVPEIFYIFDNKDLINFFKIFGGKTITVPSYEEFKLALLTVKYFYFKHIQEYDDIKLKIHMSPITSKELRKVAVYCDIWWRSLDEERKQLYLTSKGIRECV